MEQKNSETDEVGTRISDRKKQRLNEIAFELSQPGERVTISDLIREAVTDYIEKYDADPASCRPTERGALRRNSETEA